MTQIGHTISKPRLRRRRSSHQLWVAQYTLSVSGSWVLATRSSAWSTTGTRSWEVAPTAGPTASSMPAQHSAEGRPASSTEARHVRVRAKNSCRAGRSWPMAPGSSACHSARARSGSRTTTGGSAASVMRDRAST